MGNEVRIDGKQTSVRVGGCHFTYEEGSKDFVSMSLYYSNEVILTPSFVEASALYQVIRLAVIEGLPEADLLKVEKDSKEWGARLSYLRPIYENGRLSSVWISKGELSLFGNLDRLRELFHDIKEAVRIGVGYPDQYLDLVVSTYRDQM